MSLMNFDICKDRILVRSSRITTGQSLNFKIIFRKLTVWRNNTDRRKTTYRNIKHIFTFYKYLAWIYWNYKMISMLMLLLFSGLRAFCVQHFTGSRLFEWFYTDKSVIFYHKNICWEKCTKGQTNEGMSR